MIEMTDPMELIRFQVAKLSRKSEYLPDIPANPRKSWGMKVRLTPVNVIQKYIFFRTPRYIFQTKNKILQTLRVQLLEIRRSKSKLLHSKCHVGECLQIH